MDRPISLILFFFFKIILAILVTLIFHINFRIILPVLIKNLAEIMIGIVLKLEKIGIFIMNLLIHGHGMTLHLFRSLISFIFFVVFHYKSITHILLAIHINI